jgi:ribosomal protein S18 acetylase RimI-like enzyme
MSIRKAHTDDDLRRIEALAFEIIPEFYAEIIPHDHNIFFVEKFQTVEALKKQIENYFEYYLFEDENAAIGYFGIQILKDQNYMLLSKLYILKKHRGKGFGTKAMDLIVKKAHDLSLDKILLTVNRENPHTIRLYRRYGFEVSKELVNSFENGHTILDYEMTKHLR